MPAQLAAIRDALPVPSKRNKRRSRKTRGTVLAAVAKELTQTFRKRLCADDGTADSVFDAAIRRCAETTALAEHLRGQMLRGEPHFAEVNLLWRVERRRRNFTTGPSPTGPQVLHQRTNDEYTVLPHIA